MGCDFLEGYLSSIKNKNKRFLNPFDKNNNMLWWFIGKKEVKRIEGETKKGFDDVKNDINKIDKWIKYLEEQNRQQDGDISEIKESLSNIKNEIEGVKNMISMLGSFKHRQLFRQLSNKQTGVEAVQTAVQTAVEHPNLDQFSLTERSILLVLLNSEMKLSYDDLSSILGKERSTIRSQINGIKQKSDSLIGEIIEKNGKKRVFIPEEIKEKFLKSIKVRVKKSEKLKKKE